VTVAHPEPADFLEALVRIRSHSREEAEASTWLVEQMGVLGFTEARVDEAGNAVGILGDGDRTLLLLGHIDTVPGLVPVRREEGRLYGRGTVDAKGPLAAFTLAAARVGAVAGWRVAVVGAVEEESATSKGARHVAATWDAPEACIIGEPSSWRKVCLGYKGRLLVDWSLERPMTHTAGRDSSACDRAHEFWRGILDLAERRNEGAEREFDRLSPTLRRMDSSGDGLTESASLGAGLRVPTSIRIAELEAEIERLASADPGAAVAFSSGEEAVRGDKNNALVRAFLAAIREEDGRPGFSVKTGTSDMNVVGPVFCCPILAYGPGDSSLDHTPDEHVEVAELGRAVRVLERVLRSLTSDPVGSPT